MTCFTALKKYATFSGRAQRSEYWYFFLFYAIAWAVLVFMDFVLGTNGNGFGFLGSLFVMAMMLPALGVGIRRLHDTGRSGWWTLFSAVPIIGWITITVFAAQDSEPGPNRYGANPKVAAAGGPELAAG